MFSFPKAIYLANEPVDMRKSFETLADYVSFRLGRDPRSGEAFAFIGKQRNRMKILIWEPNGYWLCSKRLEQGTFSKKTFQEKGASISLSFAEFHNLLEGIVVISSRRLKRYGDNQRKAL